MKCLLIFTVYTVLLLESSLTKQIHDYESHETEREESKKPEVTKLIPVEQSNRPTRASGTTSLYQLGTPSDQLSGGGLNLFNGGGGYFDLSGVNFGQGFGGYDFGLGNLGVANIGANNCGPDGTNCGQQIAPATLNGDFKLGTQYLQDFSQIGLGGFNQLNTAGIQLLNYGGGSNIQNQLQGVSDGTKVGPVQFGKQTNDDEPNQAALTEPVKTKSVNTAPSYASGMLGLGKFASGQNYMINLNIPTEYNSQNFKTNIGDFNLENFKSNQGDFNLQNFQTNTGDFNLQKFQTNTGDFNLQNFKSNQGDFNLQNFKTNSGDFNLQNYQSNTGLFKSEPEVNIASSKAPFTPSKFLGSFKEVSPPTSSVPFTTKYTPIKGEHLVLPIQKGQLLYSGASSSGLYKNFDNYPIFSGGSQSFKSGAVNNLPAFNFEYKKPSAIKTFNAPSVKYPGFGSLYGTHQFGSAGFSNVPKYNLDAGILSTKNKNNLWPGSEYNTISYSVPSTGKSYIL